MALVHSLLAGRKALGKVAARAQGAWTLWLMRRCWGDQLVVGPGVRFGPGVDISLEGDATLELGDQTYVANASIRLGRGSRAKIGAFSHVNGLALEVAQGGLFEAGSRLMVNTIYPHCVTRIWVSAGFATLGESVLIDGGMFRVLESGRLTIGDHSGIGMDSEIRAELSVRIGSYTMIAYRVSIFDTNTHSMDSGARRNEVVSRPSRDRGDVKRSPVDIGDDCWIGLGSAILKGAILGPRTVVGMHAVVTAGEYPADSLIVPADSRVISRAASSAGADAQAALP